MFCGHKLFQLFGFDEAFFHAKTERSTYCNYLHIISTGLRLIGILEIFYKTIEEKDNFIMFLSKNNMKRYERRTRGENIIG